MVCAKPEKQRDHRAPSADRAELWKDFIPLIGLAGGGTSDLGNAHAKGTRRNHLLADLPLETLSSHQLKLFSHQPALRCLCWWDLGWPCQVSPCGSAPRAARCPVPAQALCRARASEHSLWPWNDSRFYSLFCAGSVCTVLLSVVFFSFQASCGTISAARWSRSRLLRQPRLKVSFACTIAPGDQLCFCLKSWLSKLPYFWLSGHHLLIIVSLFLTTVLN